MRIEQQVIPGQSIGELKLGMTEEEIKRVTANSPLYYQFEFLNGKAVFIELSESVPNTIDLVCTYQGVDLFHTPAEKIITQLDETSSYYRERLAQMGFRYAFREIGLLLWRSRVLTEQNKQEDWFKEMSLENQQDEMRFQYFETVGVFTPEWPDLKIEFND